MIIQPGYELIRKIARFILDNWDHLSPTFKRLLEIILGPIYMQFTSAIHSGFDALIKLLSTIPSGTIQKIASLLGL